MHFLILLILPIFATASYHCDSCGFIESTFLCNETKRSCTFSNVTYCDIDGYRCYNRSYFKSDFDIYDDRPYVSPNIYQYVNNVFTTGSLLHRSEVTGSVSIYYLYVQHLSRFAVMPRGYHAYTYDVGGDVLGCGCVNATWYFSCFDSQGICPFVIKPTLSLTPFVSTSVYHSSAQMDFVTFGKCDVLEIPYTFTQSHTMFLVLGDPFCLTSRLHNTLWFVMVSGSGDVYLLFSKGIDRAPFYSFTYLGDGHYQRYEKTLNHSIQQRIPPAGDFYYILRVVNVAHVDSDLYYCIDMDGVAGCDKNYFNGSQPALYYVSRYFNYDYFNFSFSNGRVIIPPFKSVVDFAGNTVPYDSVGNFTIVNKPHLGLRFDYLFGPSIMVNSRIVGKPADVYVFPYEGMSYFVSNIYRYSYFSKNGVTINLINNGPLFSIIIAIIGLWIVFFLLSITIILIGVLQIPFLKYKYCNIAVVYIISISHSRVVSFKSDRRYNMALRRIFQSRYTLWILVPLFLFPLWPFIYLLRTIVRHVG